MTKGVDLQYSERLYNRRTVSQCGTLIGVVTKQLNKLEQFQSFTEIGVKQNNGNWKKNKNTGKIT